MLEPLTDTDPRAIGRYQLQGRLGVGGMGAVYLGFDRVDPGRQPAAVKVVRPDLLGDPQFRDRFRREVAAARRVKGGCVAQVLDADVDAASPWMATEYVDGVSLHAAVVRRGALAGPMVVGLATGLANALVAVHAAGLVHRDLKPSNVLLAWDGPKIIDFGIARALDATSNTATGSLLGTVAWMAPEQLRGERAGPAADVFAWALCVAFAGQGRHAFPAEAPAATAIRMLQEPPDLTDVPEHLVPLLVRALDRDPAARPRAVELVSELSGVTVGGVTDADVVARHLIGQGWDAPTPPGMGGRPPTRIAPVPLESSSLESSRPLESSRASHVSAGGTPSGAPSSPGSPGSAPMSAPRSSDGRQRSRLAVAGAAVVAVVLGAAALAATGAFDGDSAAAETPTTADLRPVSDTAGGATASATISPTPVVPSVDPSATATATATNSATATATATGPVTTPSATATTATSPAAPVYPPTVAWQRFNSGPDHASLTSDPGGGYWVEHTLGYLFTTGDAAGTRPVYTCLAGGTESFTSLSATCEGQPVGGQLGWLYASKPAEIATRPVYRCMIGNDHFDSGASDCEGQVVESLIGYVVVQ